MDAALLRCLSLLILLSIISDCSGSSAEVNKRAQKHSNPQGQMVSEPYEAITATIHDAYPTIVGSPGDIPTLDPSPTTPTTTPSTMPLTPMTGPPTMPTTGPPTTTTTTPMPPYGGGGVIGGGGGGGGGGGDGGGGGGGGGGGSWCVANPGASEKALQVGLDYACGYGGADCSQIQTGASCFNPDTTRDHASYAYNDYYQKNPAPTSCDFGGTAQLVNTDPSSGSCHFPSKGSASPTPTTPTPMMQTPPAMLSPPSPSSTLLPGIPPGEGSGFGPEPTASPNIATTTHQQFLLFLSSTSILIYILLANPV